MKLALISPSGAGKTHSSLLIAAGLTGWSAETDDPESMPKIAVIDTENGSASMEVGKPGIPRFKVHEIDPPYTLLKYVEAIDAAQKAGFEVLIIDSISHLWDGEGGMRQQKDALDAADPKGNQWAHWGPITRDHEAFKAWILKSDLHLICTIRSKQAYEQVEEDGKKKIVRLGLQPIQRDGMEYEFGVVFSMEQNHYTEVWKDRTSLFDGKRFKPSRETGETLIAWRNQAPLPPTIGGNVVAASTIAERDARVAAHEARGAAPAGNGGSKPPQNGARPPASGGSTGIANKIAKECKRCGIIVPVGTGTSSSASGKWETFHNTNDDCRKAGGDPSGTAAKPAPVVDMNQQIHSEMLARNVSEETVRIQVKSAGWAVTEDGDWRGIADSDKRQLLGWLRMYEPELHDPRVPV